MANHTSHTEHHDSGTKEIWRTFWWLLGLTLVELAIGYYMFAAKVPEGMYKHFLRGVIVVFMLWKAFYIVAYFMHLKAELKNLIMTICVPLMLFVWFILAFLWDGGSYKDLRNRYDPYHKEQSTTPAPPRAHGAHGQDAHDGHDAPGRPAPVQPGGHE